MKKYICLCGLIFLGISIIPSSASAYHDPNYSQTWNCDLCHPGGPGNGNFPDCFQCHTNTDGGNYSDQSAPQMAAHSSTVIGDFRYGFWSQECVDCHNPHHNNSITRNEGVTDPSVLIAEFTGNHIKTENAITTMSIKNLTIHDPYWADPSTWNAKTGPERGLVLLDVINTKTFWYKVLDATETTITFSNGNTYFPMAPWNKDQPMSIVYGQFIQDTINNHAVKFTGPSSMAHDESGTGLDETPDGICQVCHTQTTHWRNDGTLANHFSGWNCVICQPHEQGFKADPPPMETCQ